MTNSAEDELHKYWADSGLAHLPLTIVNLDDVSQYIDPQQYDMVKNSWPGTVVALTELDKQAFNRLVFIKHNERKTDPIIIGNRSLLGVTETISKKYLDLNHLFNLNDWFEDVRIIYKSFEYDKFGYLVLRTPTCKNEKDESGGGSCYLEGGNHRSLALAIKMNLEGFKFEPVKAVVLLQPPAQRR